MKMSKNYDGGGDDDDDIKFPKGKSTSSPFLLHHYFQHQLDWTWNRLKGTALGK